MTEQDSAPAPKKSLGNKGLKGSLTLNSNTTKEGGSDGPGEERMAQEWESPCVPWAKFLTVDTV